MLRSKKQISPAAIIIAGFVGVILIGALLLSLPISTIDRNNPGFLNAMFSSASATCVTGIELFETGLYWSAFGKAVILVLVQIGGLGIMAMALMFSILMKRKVSPREHIIFAQSMSLDSYDGLVPLIRSMLFFTAGMEGAGAAMFAVKFIPRYGFLNGLAKSVFYSVSSFCNAGLELFPDSESVAVTDDIYMCIVIAVLVICGGLGFVVWQDVYYKLRHKRKLSLYTRMVLLVSALLILVGAAVFLASEWNNAETLGSSPVPKKLVHAVFLSISCRTSGFSPFPVNSMNSISKAVCMMLMFIGGSSGSTAGGIKTATFALLLVSVFQIARGKSEINIARKRIPAQTVLRAFAIITIAVFVILTSVLVLSFTDPEVAIDDMLFTVFSAFSTAGFATGISASLSVAGKIIIMLLMFFGRIGIITVTYVIMLRLSRDSHTVSYPKTNILIG